HVDVSDYKDHVAAILKDIQSALPNGRVIVMTPPPLGFVESTIIAKGSIMRYRDACIDTVLTLKPSFKNLEFLNLWDVFMPNGEYKQPNWNPDTVKHLFYDGVHFGDEGASLLFHGLMTAIKSHWPELSPDALPTKYPSPMFLPPAKSKNVEELKRVLFKEARPVSSNTVKAMTANSTSAATLPDLSYDKIFLFGDSLTEYGSSDEDGWVLQLQQRYARKMAVENHGYGGYTSYWLKFGIPSFLSESLPARIKLVVLWIGTNDSALKGQSNQHVPAEKYKQYVKEMVNTTLAVAKDARILIITPPPIGSTLVFSYYTFDSIKLYRNTCIEAFSDLKESVGASVRQNLLLLDTWDLLVPNKAYEEPSFDPSSLNDWFKDGLHFSAKGHAKVLEAIVTAIGNNWPNLSADNVPEHLPRFNTGPSNDENNDDAVRKWLFG
ncbi:isoamyl acetate-hydrolyzing esterase, partial [Rhizoclosmatium hyalinum]